MLCRYVRMAILREEQLDLINQGQSREDFIAAALAENREFSHGRSPMFYSPRFVNSDIIAGVIERQSLETIKSGPWENKTEDIETYNTANFVIRLNGGQDAVIEQESRVFSGDALGLFESLADSINDGSHAWHIQFRNIGSKKDLDDYLRKHSGSIKKIKITFEIPNADFGIFQSLHDDIKESLTRIKGDKLKREYSSEKATITPDEIVNKEMGFANAGGGSLTISNKDDPRQTASFSSKETEYTATIDENRKIDQLEGDEINEVAQNMLSKTKEND